MKFLSLSPLCYSCFAFSLRQSHIQGHQCFKIFCSFQSRQQSTFNEVVKQIQNTGDFYIVFFCRGAKLSITCQKSPIHLFGVVPDRTIRNGCIIFAVRLQKQDLVDLIEIKRGDTQFFCFDKLLNNLLLLRPLDFTNYQVSCTNFAGQSKEHFQQMY